MLGEPRWSLLFEDDELRRIRNILERAEKYYSGKSTKELTLFAFELLEKELDLTEDSLRKIGRRLT